MTKSYKKTEAESNKREVDKSNSLCYCTLNSIRQTGCLRQKAFTLGNSLINKKNQISKTRNSSKHEKNWRRSLSAQWKKQHNATIHYGTNNYAAM